MEDFIQNVQFAAANALSRTLIVMETLTVQSSTPLSSRILGMIFFTVGLLVILIPALQQGALESSLPPLLFSTSLGLVFVIVGLVTMFDSAGATIDRKSRTIQRWVKVFITLNRSPIQFAQSADVQLIKRVNTRRKSRAEIQFVVQIDNNDIAKFTDTSQARRAAESVAQFLQCNLIDSTSGTEAIREWRYLDECIAHRVRRTGEILPKLVILETPKVIVRDHHIGKTITLNPDINGIACASLFSLIIGIIPSMFLLAVMNNGKNTFHLPSLLIMGFLMLFYFTIVRQVIWAFARKVTVTCSANEFKIEERVFFYKRTTEIPFNTLEQIILRKILQLPIISLLSDGAITLVEDTTEITIGKGLNENEASYLYALLMHSAAGSRF